MKDKMWVYLMHLGTNMWGDPWTAEKTPLGIDETVWKETIDFLPKNGFNTVVIDIGDAVEYERHPEITVKGAWSKDKLKKELDRMRSMGLTPIPKLNFSAAHDAWLKEYSKMLSTEKYYEVCRDTITEVAEVFGYPEYFHLGMDEETSFFQDGFLDYVCVRGNDLYWHDMYFMFDVCEKLGMRPWVWAGIWPHMEYDEAMTDVYVERMPKSVLQSSYWYNRMFKKKPDGTYKSAGPRTYYTLAQHGFDQVPCCSTVEGYSQSAAETMQFGKKEIPDDHLLGYMTAPWRMPYTDELYALLYDAVQFNAAKKKEYPGL